MYRKKGRGWTKHIDFMLLDVLCMQIAFIVSYIWRFGPGNPYTDKDYRIMGTIIPVEDIGKLEEIIMDYDQIATGMGHGMSGNNEKFCSGLEDIIHYIL